MKLSTWLRTVSVTIGLLMMAAGGRAHPMANSSLYVDLSAQGIKLSLELPLSALEKALGRKVGHGDERTIAGYLRDHIGVRSGDGTQRFAVTVSNIWIDSLYEPTIGPYFELRAHLSSAIGNGLDPYDFVLDYDVITHQLHDHITAVRLRGILRDGVTKGDSRELAVIAWDGAAGSVPPLRIRPGAGGPWLGFTSMFAVGVHHIAVGTDHLLFLITLLLIAPLRAVNGRWTLFQGWRYTLQRFLGISLAFTLGHSFSLSAAATGLVNFHIQWIEILIAVSILLTAINCLRPYFGMREGAVALMFGLVHGLAFSETITALDLAATDRVIALLGFNLGIETMQVAVMLICFPVLYLSKFSAYRYLRWGLALGTGIAAVVWVAERAA